MTNQTRRGFLGQVLGAVSSPLLPKGSLAALGELSDALPDMAKYVLKHVPKKMMPFLSNHIDGFAFLTDNERIESETYVDHLAHRAVCLFPTPNLLKSVDFLGEGQMIPHIAWYAALFDSRVSIPEEISDGVPFKIGHLICKQNALHYWYSDYSFCDPDKDELLHAAEDGLEQFGYHVRDLERILLSRPDLDGIEKVATMGVKEFYESVARPILKDSLGKALAIRIASGEPADLGREIFEFDENLLDGLKKEFPEYSKIFDDSINQFIMQEDVNWAKKQNPKACFSYAPGHFRLEKQGIGAYKLHAPQIL